MPSPGFARSTAVGKARIQNERGDSGSLLGSAVSFPSRPLLRVGACVSSYHRPVGRIHP
jgi:hypothetical protein